MKKLKFLLIISLIGLLGQVKAQDYVPFPTEDAVWNIKMISEEMPGQRHFYFLNGDTIINDTTYTKVYHTLDHTLSTSSYNCCIREEEQRIFVRYPYARYLYENEFLLYDFNLEVGDAVILKMTHNFTSELIDVEFVLGAVGNIQLNTGDYRRSYIYNTDDYDMGDISVIDGIGASDGMAGHLFYCELDPGDLFELMAYYLDCFTLNGDNIYGNCTTDNIEINSYDKTYISNIPVNNNSVLHLDIKQEYKTIQVFDIQGRILYQENIRNKTEFSFKNINLKSGFYLLKLTGNKKSKSMKFITQ